MRLGWFLQSMSRRFFSRKKDDTFLTGWHMIPMGESDLSPKTRMSYIADDMMENDLVGIGAISQMGFRMFDGTFLYGPIAVFPKAVLSWRVLSPSDITAESVEFLTMLEPKLDVVVAGAGDRCNVDSVRSRIAPLLTRHKIGLEVMETEQAIALFNLLNYEGRYVSAVLYPPDDLLVTDEQNAEAMNMAKSFDMIDNYVTPGLLQDEAKEAARKIWKGDDLKRMEALLDSKVKLIKDK